MCLIPIVVSRSSDIADEFDPLRSWGEPQCLPSPPSPTTTAPPDTQSAATDEKKSAKVSDSLVESV